MKYITQRCIKPVNLDDTNLVWRKIDEGIKMVRVIYIRQNVRI